MTRNGLAHLRADGSLDPHFAPGITRNSQPGHVSEFALSAGARSGDRAAEVHPPATVNGFTVTRSWQSASGGTVLGYVLEVGTSPFDARTDSG